jgi:hypothetical protein
VTVTPTVVASAVTSTGPTNVTYPVSLGGTATAGQFLAVLVSISGTVTTPSGWTLAASKSTGTSSLASYLFHKTAAGGETSVNLTLSDAYSQVVAVGVIFGGVDTSDPFANVADEASALGASSISDTVASDAINQLCVMWQASKAFDVATVTATTPATFIDVGDATSAYGYAQASAGYKDLSSSVGTQNVSTTLSAAVNEAHMYLWALNPTPDAGGATAVTTGRFLLAVHVSAATSTGVVVNHTATPAVIALTTSIPTVTHPSNATVTPTTIRATVAVPAADTPPSLGFFFTTPVRNIVGTWDHTAPLDKDWRIRRRLARHMNAGARGVNVYLLTDGTVTEIQPDNWDVVDRVFYGGHEAHQVNSEEKAILEAAGYTVVRA